MVEPPHRLSPAGLGLVTGLVLAGGEGRRMGLVDKGLLRYEGQPLALRAAQHLAPQVSSVMLSANRHLDTYAGWGYPVWPDGPGGSSTAPGTPCASPPDFQGPLAGVLQGLLHCPTPYLVTVPCDCPDFPRDLVERLAERLAVRLVAPFGPDRHEAQVAIARSPRGLEPAFCLISTTVRPQLQQFLATGQRSIERWTAGLTREEVSFDDPRAFRNLNTPADLRATDPAPPAQRSV